MEGSLSIIIPTLNEASTIPGTLISCLHAAPEAEIIVADGGSRDATVPLARCCPGVACCEVLGGPRALQCNVAARRAGGDTLLFLHADTTITSVAIRAMWDALRDPRVAGGSFRFALADAVGRFRLTEWGANLRARWMRLPFGDQGIFCRRTAFEAIGGFPAIPLMDDVRFLRALRKQGRLALVPCPVYTSARRIRRHGVLKNATRNWTLLLAHRLGIRPKRLAHWYHRM